MNVAATAGAGIGAGMDAEEWQLRCDLAALYRLVAHFRMTDFIYTHISARVPGPAHHFLINRYGVLFHEMRASDLVKIDLEGRCVDKRPESEVNRAGFVIHSAIHAARPDLACVVHTHTAAGIAVSAQAEGLLPLSQHAARFFGRISYHGYEGIALDMDERERLVADLGANQAMILRNHGLLVCGRSIPEAFLEIYFLERACQAQIAAQSGGVALTRIPEAVAQRTAAQFASGSERGAAAHAAMAWGSALRLIENDRPDYRS